MKLHLLSFFILSCKDLNHKVDEGRLQKEGTHVPDEVNWGIVADDMDEPAELVPEDDPCVEEVEDFDVEELSYLQDAFGRPFLRDAVTLNYDPDQGVGGLRWRITNVDLLILIPNSEFQDYDNDQSISIEIFDAPDPREGSYWIKTLTVIKEDLEWEDYQLPNIAATAQELDQQGAWMSFSFLEEMNLGDMTSLNFTTGVRWDGTGTPTVGYSNYVQDCYRNWTLYSENTDWQLNGQQNGLAQRFTCSWPMLMITIERTYMDECEE